VFDLREDGFAVRDTSVPDLQHAASTAGSAFTEALVRLAATTDVADELLQRVTNRGCYKPWAEGPAARQAWRAAHGKPLQHLRDYRNRLLHGRLMPYEVHHELAELDGVTIVKADALLLRFPKIGREAAYLDWRTLTDLSVIVLERDFAAADEIVAGGWTETLAYLEDSWKKYL
jgi:hypothetical protein